MTGSIGAVASLFQRAGSARDMLIIGL